MKLPAKIAILSMSGAAGFLVTLPGLRAWGPEWSRGSKNPHAPHAVQVGAVSGAEVSASGKTVKQAPTGQGVDLAGQLRAALTLMGLDPSWAEDLAAADASGFPALVERMKTLPERQRFRLMELLLGRWAMIDPAGGAAFFKEQGDGNLGELLQQWQRLDFPAAAAMAEQCEGSMLTDTLSDKAVRDPQGLLTWLRNRPDLNPIKLFPAVFATGAEVDALRSLMKADTDQMLVWSRALPENQWGGGFVGNFAETLATRNADEAIAWAKSLTIPGHSAEALARVAATLAASEPERALALMAGLSKEEQGNAPYERVIDRLDLSDPDKIPALAEALPQGGMRGRLMKATVSALLEKDPAKAFSLLDAEGMDAGPQDAGQVPATVKTPEGARRVLEAAGAAKASSGREVVVKEALLGWMDREPASLADYLRGKMDSPLLTSMRENLQEGLAMQTLLTGTANPALVDLIGLPPETLVKVQLQRDPAKAAAALDTVENPAARVQLAGDIASGMGPANAAAWSGVLTNEAEQAAAWKTIAREWVTQDSLKASAWISTLPDGTARDGAVMALTQQVSRTDPDLAWKWALSMTDSPRRQEALSTAAQAWNHKDAAALRQALDAGNFTPAEREKLMPVGPSSHPGK